MVTLYTGEINSGKTQAMRGHYMRYGKGDGFFCIKHFENGSHTGYDLELIAEKKAVPFIRTEEQPGEKIQYRLGKYIFLKNGFEKAQKKLFECRVQALQPVYIDELGILESRKECFYQKTKELLEQDAHVITAVRSSLLKEIIAVFSITEYTILQVR